MTPCETCGNTYEKAFTVTQQGISRVFDSFQCAITKMAPTCAVCGCRIIGHGTEVGDVIYCCDHCAQVGAPSRPDLAHS